MKGKIHKILNDKAVMKDVEVIIEMPSGSPKFTELRVGEYIQIVKVKKPKTKKKGRKMEANNEDPGRL